MAKKKVKRKIVKRPTASVQAEIVEAIREDIKFLQRTNESHIANRKKTDKWLKGFMADLSEWREAMTESMDEVEKMPPYSNRLANEVKRLVVSHVMIEVKERDIRSKKMIAEFGDRLSKAEGESHKAQLTIDRQCMNIRRLLQKEFDIWAEKHDEGTAAKAIECLEKRDSEIVEMCEKMTSRLEYVETTYADAIRVQRERVDSLKSDLSDPVSDLAHILTKRMDRTELELSKLNVAQIYDLADEFNAMGHRVFVLEQSRRSWWQRLKDRKAARQKRREMGKAKKPEPEHDPFFDGVPIMKRTDQYGGQD